MKNFNLAGYSFSFKNLFLCLWLIILTSVSLINLAMITEGDQTNKSSEYDSRFQQIFAQLAIYSERLESQQQDPVVKQAELATIQQELYLRIQAISDQLEQFALKKEVAELQNRITTNNERIDKLEADISTLSIQIHSLNTAQPKTKTLAKSNVVYSPPFAVLGAELRGGERMLVILPKGKSSIDSVQLIGAGQSYGNWQLQSFNSKTAVFTVGNKTRRLAISR